MLGNSTTANKINPGRIRELLSIPVTGKSAPSSTKKIVNKSYVTINRKPYREVEKNVMCYLSRVSLSSVDFLVDRDANGGVAGNNVRIMSKYSDRNVDVRGIENYEITSMPLVAAGGVALTTSGEVIVIMH